MMRRFCMTLGMLGVFGCATLPGASIMLSPQHNWLAVGYDEDRSDSILKTQRAAEQHCRAQDNRRMQLLSTVTVYQGRFDETVTEAARAAGDVAWVYGHVEGAQAGRVFASDTDYKTTIEFRCQ